jgi:hypothetical protein
MHAGTDADRGLLIRKYRHNEAVNESSFHSDHVYMDTGNTSPSGVQSRSSWWIMRGFTPGRHQMLSSAPPPSKTAQTSPLVLSPLLNKNTQGKPLCSPSSSGVQDQIDSFQDPHEFIDILDIHVSIGPRGCTVIGPASEFEERDDEDGREGGVG